jgi:septum formation topological specificity factor MinE
VTLSLLSWFVNREKKTNENVNRRLVNISHSDATADKADDDVKATRGRDVKDDK